MEKPGTEIDLRGFLGRRVDKNSFRMPHVYQIMIGEITQT